MLAAVEIGRSDEILVDRQAWGDRPTVSTVRFLSRRCRRIIDIPKRRAPASQARRSPYCVPANGALDQQSIFGVTDRCKQNSFSAFDDSGRLIPFNSAFRERCPSVAGESVRT
jgi:hypothetical protein